MKRNSRIAHSLLRARQRLGKYKIESRLADGDFAAVYRAFDTIEGQRVALKIPHLHLTDEQFLKDFRHEVRLAAQLDHRNILPLKNAGFIDKYFVIVYPLGEKSLSDRLQHRIALRTALDYAEQMLEAVAYAHSRRIIHCDIKPDNFLLFRGNRLRLADFGIAKMSIRTLEASGSGTIGYIAPEQAMGRPSFQSDVFSLGLVMYRMLTGHLPAWPYEWPPAPGLNALRRRLHPDLVRLLQRAISVKPSGRYRDAGQMLKAFQVVKTRALRYRAARGRRPGRKSRAPDWQIVRRKQFQRDYGRALDTRYACGACGGPVAEAMRACPWCGAARGTHREDTRFPARCPRCGRGRKLDWTYCAWCHGPGFKDVAERTYTDVRYTARCANPSCSRKELMPFMRYCPWCRRATKRKWAVPGSRDRCSACGWGVLKAFWDYCPWCGTTLAKGARS